MWKGLGVVSKWMFAVGRRERPTFCGVPENRNAAVVVGDDDSFGGWDVQMERKQLQ